MKCCTFTFIKLLFLSTTIVVAGCGGSGGASATTESDTASNNAPVIAQILTDIRLIPQEYGGVTRTPFESLNFFVEVDVKDPQGFADIDYIYVESPGGDYYWTLYESENFGPYRQDCRYGDSDIYGCLFLDPDSPHSILLKGWHVVVKDKAGNETTTSFDFKLPSGRPASLEQFVYTEYYTGSTVGGLETLGKPKNVSVISDAGAQSYQFRFTIDDTRVTKYGIEFWVTDDTHVDYWVFAGWLGQESPSISSTALVQGLNVVNIPWSEIQLDGSYTVSDIDGFHIVAFDEPEVISRDYSWFNYLSDSDFVDIR